MLNSKQGRSEPCLVQTEAVSQVTPHVKTKAVWNDVEHKVEQPYLDQKDGRWLRDPADLDPEA